MSNSVIPADSRESVYIEAKEAMEILHTSPATVSRCFKAVNAKMKADGKFTMRGRCNRRAFYDYIGYEA